MFLFSECNKTSVPSSENFRHVNFLIPTREGRYKKRRIILFISMSFDLCDGWWILLLLISFFFTVPMATKKRYEYSFSHLCAKEPSSERLIYIKRSEEDRQTPFLCVSCVSNDKSTMSKTGVFGAFSVFWIRVLSF